MRWSCVTSTDPTLFAGRYRAQVLPARATPQGPDDVGLGETIEAGLRSRLLLRKRVHCVVVCCPACLALRWRDELDQRFRAELRHLREQLFIDSQTTRAVATSRAASDTRCSCPPRPTTAAPIPSPACRRSSTRSASPPGCSSPPVRLRWRSVARGDHDTKPCHAAEFNCPHWFQWSWHDLHSGPHGDRRLFPGGRLRHAPSPGGSQHHATPKPGPGLGFQVRACHGLSQTHLAEREARGRRDGRARSQGRPAHGLMPRIEDSGRICPNGGQRFGDRRSRRLLVPLRMNETPNVHSVLKSGDGGDRAGR